MRGRADPADAGIRRADHAEAPASIAVPRPAADETVTVTVQSGHPLSLGFRVEEVISREIAGDDLVLGFGNGGTVVLENYMHAFGRLGEHRTTIIEPDGKRYAFGDLLAPAAGPGERAPPESDSDVILVPKPPAGTSERAALTAEKPIALDFEPGDVARSRVDSDGNLALTFKDKAMLVLENYAAFAADPDFALYGAKGDKVTLGDLAPGAGTDIEIAAGGHLFSPFEAGRIGDGLAHLGPLDAAALPPMPPGSASGVPAAGLASGATPTIDDIAHGSATSHAIAPADEAGRTVRLTLVTGKGCIVGGDVVGDGTSAAGQADLPVWGSREAWSCGWADGHDAPQAQGQTHPAATMPGMDQQDSGAGNGVALGQGDLFHDAGAQPELPDAAAAVAAVTFADNAVPAIQPHAQDNVMGH